MCHLIPDFLLQKLCGFQNTHLQIQRDIEHSKNSFSASFKDF